jgi:hypothetical protein
MSEDPMEASHIIPPQKMMLRRYIIYTYIHTAICVPGLVEIAPGVP